MKNIPYCMCYPSNVGGKSQQKEQQISTKKDHEDQEYTFELASGR